MTARSIGSTLACAMRRPLLTGIPSSTQQDSRHCFFSRKLACCKGRGRALAMLTAQRQSIRLLQTVLAAAVAVPALLFCFAAWQAYKNDEGVAEDQIERSRDVGTFIGAVLRPRAPYGGSPFFGVSRRRMGPDGSFAGIIQASVLPDYFEGFYAKIGKAPGSYFSLIRDDGLILARYPALSREMRLPAHGNLLKAFRVHPVEGTLTLTSLIDGVSRRVSYLRLPELPVFVLSGLEMTAIRDEWISQMSRHLIFGIPATGALIFLVALTLRRTTRMYEEANRREVAEGALKHAQRLEALGRLTGGVAHDFNNLLMVVGGSARKLRRADKDAQELRSLQMIEAAVQKGERLTRKLLAFSRRQSLSPEIIDLPECVRKLRAVLEQSVQDDVEMELVAPAKAIAVKV